jgi:hypothetical protein
VVKTVDVVLPLEAPRVLQASAAPVQYVYSMDKLTISTDKTRDTVVLPRTIAPLLTVSSTLAQPATPTRLPVALAPATMLAHRKAT